jgi:hypothetical protein
MNEKSQIANVKSLLKINSVDIEPQNFETLRESILEELTVLEKELKRPVCKGCHGSNCYCCPKIETEDFADYDFDLFRRKMLLECIYELIGEYLDNSPEKRKDILYLVHGMMERNLDT